MQSRSERRTGLGFAAAASVLVVSSVETEAQALPLVTLWGSLRGEHGSVAGDGSSVSAASSSGQQQTKVINPYGFGLELAAGATLPLSLYVGASFDAFFGETESLGSGLDVSRSCYQLMGNLGYDFGLGPLTLRPELGVGYSLGTIESKGGAQNVSARDVSTNGAIVAPGAEFFVGLGLLNLSAQARYQLVTGTNSNSVVLGLGVGVSL